MKKEINLLNTITTLENQSIVKIDDSYYIAKIETLNNHQNIDHRCKKELKELSKHSCTRGIRFIYKNDSFIIPEQYFKNKDIFYIYLTKLEQTNSLEIENLPIENQLLLYEPIVKRTYLKYSINNQSYTVYVSEAQISHITILNDTGDKIIRIDKTDNPLHNLKFHLFQYISKYYGKNRCF